MLNIKTQELDKKILAFVKRYANGTAPEAEFNALALKLFVYQYEKNENYKKFCEAEGASVQNAKHWKQVPAMPTLGFKELVLATFPVSKALKVFKTSGTTTQTRGAHFFDTLALYEASIVPPFKSTFLKDRESLDYYFLIKSPKDAPDSSLSHMMGVVNRVFARNKGRFYVGKKEPDFERLEKDLLVARKPVFLLATALSLKAFLDYLKAGKRTLSLPKGSRLMETGGFKGSVTVISKKKLYTEAQKVLGLSKRLCFSEYGMTELSSQMYDSGNGFQGPAWLKAMVIDIKTGREAREGQSGIVRFVDLANRGSVMAVQTEDFGRMRNGKLKLLGRVPQSELRGCSLTYEEFLKEGVAIG